MRISKKILAAFVAALMVIAMPMSALADMTEFYGTGSHGHMPPLYLGQTTKSSGGPAIPFPGMEAPAAVAPATLNDVDYDSLEAAVAAAVDGDTIYVNCYTGGNGIKFPQGKFNNVGLTIDFGGYEYWVDGTLVGSTGTETNGFQLLKDNNITLKNGAIYSFKAKILLQNYSNLTLDNMSVKTCNNTYWNCYTLSNNNGNVLIKDSVVSASEHLDPMTNIDNNFAFDVCRYASYPEVHVTVEGNSEIYGNIEVYASGSDARNGFSLDLQDGTYTGKVVLTKSAGEAMENYPEKVSITKDNSVDVAVSNGYEWDGEGKLVESTPVDTMSITVEDNIDLNINVDVKNTADAEKIRYSFATPDVENSTTQTVEQAANEATENVKVELAPAQIMDEITVEVLDADDNVIRETTTSIADYCEAIIESPVTETITEELKELAKATLDYGKAAAEYFDYNTEAFEGKTQQITDTFNENGTFDDAKNNNGASGISVTSVAYRATSKPELLFRVSTSTPEYVLAETALTVEGVEGATAKFVKVGDVVYVQVSNLNITDFNKTISVYGGGFNINYVPISWVVAASNASGAIGTLGNAIGNYYVASAAYFAS
jgi:hypothetical protein